MEPLVTQPPLPKKADGAERKDLSQYQTVFQAGSKQTNTDVVVCSKIMFMDSIWNKHTYQESVLKLGP